MKILELKYTLTLDNSKNLENRLLTIDPDDKQADPKPSFTNQISLRPSMVMCQDLVVYLKVLYKKY